VAKPSRTWFTGTAFVLVVLVIGFNLIADQWDRQRITEAMDHQGLVVDSITWQPFAFWWQKDSDRTYLVECHTTTGLPKRFSCRTSLFGGVYTSEE
jgi:hypothetical protein